MKKIAIIGASYLQVPLIEKANELDLETHVFAWEEGSIGKSISDKFYPISITEKNKILQKCEEIQIDGICSIGSDLAMPTVNHIADHMGIIGNSKDSTNVTTNKYAMRQRLSQHNLPCPKYIQITPHISQIPQNFPTPFIVKPTDRSGSRGVTKVNSLRDSIDSISRAMVESLTDEVIVEEFIEGREISIEMISWQGTHHFITCTDKVCTGEPYFVEKEQHMPANLSDKLKNRIVDVVKASLSALGVDYGASHSEIIVTEDERIFLIEIGARMGGDHIGSALVPLSTGYDFLKGVIEIALGEFTIPNIKSQKHSGIIFITPKAGKVTAIINNSDKYQEIVKSEILVNHGDSIIFPVTSSAQRSAYFIYSDYKAVNVKPEEIIEIITE